MAADKRLALQDGAWICFQDEAGASLRPPKARTWSRRGITPVVKVNGAGSGRLSMVGLIAMRPGSRTRLCYRVKAHRGRKGERRSLSEADYIALLDAVHQQLRAPIVLVWDRLNTHRSAAMRRMITARPWLRVFLLPAYAQCR